MSGVEKPAYMVMPMSKIRNLPPNGFNVVSTFSGCGGSSLGYRMAGFKVLWASEFIDAARDSYNANKAPYTILDPRDIRNVKADDILKATGLGFGEIDLFDGSPPCASFSTAGKREKAWGKVKKYSDKAQRVDDLFFEFSRILKDLQPKTFVAENVSGLIKGTAKGYFIEILQELRSAGYRVKAKVLNSMWLGVPQKRERLIFIGVRNDIEFDPVHPTPLTYWYSAGEAISGLNDRDQLCCWLKKNGKLFKYWDQTPTGKSFSIGSERAFGKATAFQMMKACPNRPIATIVQGSQGVHHWIEPRTLSIAELKRCGGFPDDFILSGSFSKQWERIGRAVPPVMMMHIAASVRDNILRKIKS